MELYCVNCMPLKDRLAEALALLPQQLRVRAEVYRRQDDQLRSVAASLLLLRILGTEQTRALEYGHAGKPFLSGGPEFNLSHSGTYAVLAVGRQPLGVDIEAPRSISPLLRKRCFTSGEQLWARDDNARYLQLWTRKESVMKATGLGLSLPAREIDAVQDKTAVCGKIWFLHSLQLGVYTLSTAASEPSCPILHMVDAAFLLNNN